MERNYFEKVRRNENQTTLVYDISKTYQKEISLRSRFFVFEKHIKIISPKLHQISIEIASKKIHWSNGYLSFSEITSKKMRRNEVKNYIKNLPRNDGNSMIFSFRCIDVILTSNRRWFDVVCPLRTFLQRWNRGANFITSY